MPITFEVIDLKQHESRSRVGWFFRREADMMSCTPMLFDDDRWSQCDNAIIAAENRDLVGIVTLAVDGIDNSGKLTLDTLYVAHRHQRKGLGYSLFERGVLWLIERKPNEKVFCCLQSSKMLSLVARLPAGLRDCLEIYDAFHDGDLADEFDFLENDPLQ